MSRFLRGCNSDLSIDTELDLKNANVLIFEGILILTCQPILRLQPQNFILEDATKICQTCRARDTTTVMTEATSGKRSRENIQ